MHFKILICCSCFWFAFGSLSGQDTVRYTGNVIGDQYIRDLSPITLIAEDTSSAIDDPGELIRIKHSFIPLRDYHKEYNQESEYWLRLTLTPKSTINNWWLILTIDEPGYEYFAQWSQVDFFIVDPLTAHQEHQRSGYQIPRSKKKLQKEAGFVGAEISLTANNTVDIYVHLHGSFNVLRPGQLGLELRNPAAGLPQNAFIGLLYALSAIAGTLSILSFFFYLFVREKAYLFFFLYLVFLSLHYLILHPQIPFINIFIPEHPYMIDQIFMILAPGGFILFLLFGRYFINLPSLSLQTDKWLMRFLALWTLIIVLEVIFMIILDRHVLFPAAFFMVVISMGFMVRIAFFKSTLVRFFVAGAAWLLVFTMLGLLFDEQLSATLINPWPIGQLGQILIYMAGLAYKIRQSEHAKAEAIRIREMDDIKSRFFANISHEFRTPLTLIRGIVQQINERTTPRQIKDENIHVTFRQLTTLQRHADRLLELVNQLLDLSRLDSGKMKLHIIRGDVLQLLRSLSHAFDSMAERKQIHYHIHFPERTEIAFFDQDKLEKIFTNLLSNAFKYTPERGTVSVTVSMDEGRLRMIVDDSGPGIHKKELDKVFDRFYQVVGTEDKGSGIGLALVKELTDLYRGQISVSSDPGKGTQFRISLPMNKESFSENEFVYGEWMSEMKNTPVDIPEMHADESEVHQSGLPVMLVVEDNPDLRQFIRESMQSSYHVIEAENGNKGLDMALSEMPDVIVSDVMMPGMDGFALTSKIKHDDRTSHIPVILLTAKAGQTHKIEGLGTGADDYVSKPFDVKELLVRVQNLIDSRKLLRRKFARDITLKPSEVTADTMDDQFLRKVMDAIERNMHLEEFGVEELAREVAMSRSQLHRKLTALVDKSPSDILRQTRLLRAKELLQKKASTPAEVAFEVGFNSHSYFSKCFKDEFGVSPSDLKIGL